MPLNRILVNNLENMSTHFLSFKTYIQGGLYIRLIYNCVDSHNTVHVVRDINRTNNCNSTTLDRCYAATSGMSVTVEIIFEKNRVLAKRHYMKDGHNIIIIIIPESEKRFIYFYFYLIIPKALGDSVRKSWIFDLRPTHDKWTRVAITATSNHARSQDTIIILYYFYYCIIIISKRTSS